MSDGVSVYRSDHPEPRVREAFRAGEIPVTVYGLGKMGLPLASVYADCCGAVTGVDVDQSVVDGVNDGRCHISGEPGLETLVVNQVGADRLQATTDGVAAAERASIHVIIVPTLLDSQQNPDLSLIGAVTDTIAAGLAPGDLVVAESTLPPGTCEETIAPALAEQSGLEPGQFGVAFCPERTASGTALRDIRGQYPKVVGGVDEASAQAAGLVYDELTTNEVHIVSDATTAETVKVFEGVYRDVNIALANELATVTDDLDISFREAAATANAIPQCELHEPGPGVGGHCIPYYPHFLLAQTGRQLGMTRQGRETNESMPAYSVSLLEQGLAAAGVAIEDASVAVLGITYRPGVEETRASPALGVIDRLQELGAKVYGLDPLVDPGAYGATPLDLESFADVECDGAIVVTPHEAFGTLEWERLDPMVIVDGRDAMALEDTHHRVITLGGQRGNRPQIVDGRLSTTVRSRSQRPDGGAVGENSSNAFGDPNV